MKLGGTFLGALVGAVIGGAIWFVMDTRGPSGTQWAPLIVGALAGIGARLAAKPCSAQILRGALTAAIALGAMVGTTYAIRKQLEHANALQNANRPNLTTSSSSDATDIEDESAEDEADSPPGEGEVVEETVTESVAEDESETEADISETVEEQAVEEPGAEAETVQVPVPAPPAATPPGVLSNRALTDSSVMVAVYYAVGTLLAYFLGKGKSLPPATPPAVSSQPS